MDSKIEKKLFKIIDKAEVLIKSGYDKETYLKNEDFIKQVCTGVFGTYTLPYLFSTENISGYFNKLDLENKSILTVVGSGDHILNAILKGAKTIDAFDISSYAVMFYYLKEAAIKTLSYEEFIEYFLDPNKCFNLELYCKIRNNMNQEVLPFWDELYNRFKDNPANLKYMFRSLDPVFITDPVQKVTLLSGVNPYLNETKYYELKVKIQDAKVNCYMRDVNQLDNIGENYDYIFLSNILQYQKDQDFINFKQSISRYITKLNNNGEIKIGYIYGHLKDLNQELKLLKQSLEIEEIEMSKAPSYYFSIFTPGSVPIDDGVVEYKKK